VNCANCGQELQHYGITVGCLNGCSKILQTMSTTDRPLPFTSIDADAAERVRLAELVRELQEQLTACEQELAEARTDKRTNAGTTCDTKDGPCACGAWHGKGEKFRAFAEKVGTPPTTVLATLHEAVVEYGQRPAIERADDMVARGVVNSKGEVTTKIGGDAMPENANAAVNALLESRKRGPVLVRNGDELYGVTGEEIEAAVDAVRKRDERIAELEALIRK